jgi:antitoxin component YwqK of YwqJK toxin-antitoxin module
MINTLPHDVFWESLPPFYNKHPKTFQNSFAGVEQKNTHRNTKTLITTTGQAKESVFATMRCYGGDMQWYENGILKQQCFWKENKSTAKRMNGGTTVVSSKGQAFLEEWKKGG